jgi:hypothetical protein
VELLEELVEMLGCHTHILPRRCTGSIHT